MVAVLIIEARDIYNDKVRAKELKSEYGQILKQQVIRINERLFDKENCDFR